MWHYKSNMMKNWLYITQGAQIKAFNPSIAVLVLTNRKRRVTIGMHVLQYTCKSNKQKFIHHSCAQFILWWCKQIKTRFFYYSVTVRPYFLPLKEVHWRMPSEVRPYFLPLKASALTNAVWLPRLPITADTTAESVVEPARILWQ